MSDSLMRQNWKEIKGFAVDWGDSLAALCITLLFFFYSESKTNTYFRMTLFLLVISYIYSIWKKKERKDKEKEKLENFDKIRIRLNEAEESIQELLTGFPQSILDMSYDMLQMLFVESDIKTDNDRISLYLHDKEKENFILVGRYSSHPKYTKKNRLTFPEDQGVIGKAWLDGGEFFYNKFETFEDNEDKYKKISKDIFKINIQTSDKIRMKSRLYYAKAIEKDRKKIGVIVCESKTIDAFTKDKMSDDIEGNSEYLIAFFTHMNTIKQLLVLEEKNV